MPFVVPEVRIVTNICNIFTKANTKAPWAPSVEVAEGINYFTIRKDDRGVSRAMGLVSTESTRKSESWAGFVDVITNARDSTVERLINDFYIRKDTERPGSFVSAFCGANVPKVIDVVIPAFTLGEGSPVGEIPSFQVKMRASSRKGNYPEVVLDSDFVPWFLAGAKAWNDYPPPTPIEAHDNDATDDADHQPAESAGDVEVAEFDAEDILPVRWRKKRGFDYLMIEWMDRCGEKHTLWQLPRRESQVQEMVTMLKAAYHEELSNGGSAITDASSSKDKAAKRQRTLMQMFNKTD